MQHLRNLLNADRHRGPEQQTAFDALHHEMDERGMGNQLAADEGGIDTRSSDIHSTSRDRRRIYLEAQSQAYDAVPASESLPQTSDSSTLLRNRRRAFRPSERLQRYQRERIAQSGRTSEAYVSPSNSSPARPEQTLDESGGQHNAKRRKLDDGTHDEAVRTFSYGDKGQVVPGQLRLEVMSCDGGEYSDSYTMISSYPQNILQDDSKVYCTKSNQCNLLLGHVGGMPFTLTKIVVKAPRSGYDAPIQSGLVFIAMEDDNLLERTSHHDMRWSPKIYRHDRRRRDPYRPSHEYMNSTRPPLRAIDRSRYLNNPGPEDDGSSDTPLVPGFEVMVGDPSEEEDLGESPPSPRPWHDDGHSMGSYVDRYRPIYLGDERDDGPWSNSSDSDEADLPSEQRALASERDRLQQQQLDVENTLAHRNRMLDLMRAQQIREDDEFYTRPQSRGYDQERSSRRASISNRSLRSTMHLPARSDPSQVSDGRSHGPTTYSPSTSKGSRNAAKSTTANPSQDTVLPHARFFISRSKCSTAIKFDPPVSGRYILVKLWAQCPNANIDIQAILAYGYGGPRFFPSMEMR